MNLPALQTFLAIVETGSLARAAERLHVTQSTVTARLQQLEGELGQTLILRRKSGARLTAAGRRFHHYADVMTGLWRQARQETALPDGAEGACNLGCHSDLWPGLGERLVAAIRRERPAMALSVWPGEIDALDRRYGAGLVDAALTYQPGSHEGQTIAELPAERLRLYADEPDAPTRFNPGYVYVDHGEDFRRRHAAAYADASVTRVTFGSARWALRHLLEHGGSAYLPERLVRAAGATGRLHELADAPVFERRVYLLSRDGARDNAWLLALTRSLERSGGTR